MRKITSIFMGIGMAAILLSSCSKSNQTLSGLDPAAFDTTINGKPVKLYTLTNKSGMEVCITNFGGRVVSLMTRDKNGAFVDVVLGYDNIKQYADTVNSPSDFGATAVLRVGSIRCMMPSRSTRRP
jgi:aldose 1-epimerase